jgi:hypothetical protein
VIKLAVPDSGPGRHDLNLSRPDHRTGSDAVLVLERALEDVGNDLHVPVPVGIEPGARLDAIFVDHPQRTKAHVPGIAVIAERKRVPAIQPSEIGPSSFRGGANSDHGGSPFVAAFLRL